MVQIIRISLILVLLLFACNRQEGKSIEEKLRGEDYKYWIIYKDYPAFEYDSIFPKDEFISIDYFDKYGKTLYFYKRNLKSDLRNNSDNTLTDFEVSNKWHFKNDSILIINDKEFIIKILEDDMMVLYNQYTKRSTLYIAAPDSLIPVKYHCIQ